MGKSHFTGPQLPFPNYTELWRSWRDPLLKLSYFEKLIWRVQQTFVMRIEDTETYAENVFDLSGQTIETNQNGKQH